MEDIGHFNQSVYGSMSQASELVNGAVKNFELAFFELGCVIHSYISLEQRN